MTFHIIIDEKVATATVIKITAIIQWSLFNQ